MSELLERDQDRRRRLSEEVAERLDGLMTFLGILFVLVVLGETLVRNQSPWSSVFTWLGWLIWLAFVAEFLLRLALAPQRSDFLRKNWWQVLFLVLPFLRFVRMLRAVRISRAGRLLSSAVRGGRTAASELRSRAGWLVAVTAIVILSSAQILFEFAEIERFSEAIHASAYGAISGEPITHEHPVADVLEIILALYSVIVFAAVASIFAAYLLKRSAETKDRDATRQVGGGTDH